jgi:cell division protein FtsB
MARSRPTRRRIGLRWLALGLVALVAFLYWRPVNNYVETRRTLDQRRAQVRSLRAQKQALERRLEASTSPAALAREARRLGFVEPGQHLYIVKGIDGWERDRRGTLADGGR